MKLSPLVERIAGEAADAWDLHSLAREAEKTDPEVIVLSVGDPDLDTPKVIVDSLIASVLAGRTHYSSALGEPRLREAVAAHYQRQGFEQVKANNVVIVTGTQTALFCAAMCLLSTGDEVLIPEPMYVTYPGFIGSAGATIVPVALAADEGFRLDPEAIAKAISPRSRAILLNSPHNPTGSVIDRESFERVAELCLEHDLWLISDEVYQDIYYDQPPCSALSLKQIQDRTLLCSSLSKSHAMSGWRLGWVIVPDELEEAMYNLLSSMLYGAPMFIQDAAITALEQLDWVVELREIFKSRRDLFCQALDELSLLSYLKPQGGMFVMLDVRKTGLSAPEFARRFYQEEKVSLLSADAFGPSAKGYLRLSLTVSETKLKEVAKRLARFLEHLAL